MQMGVKNRFQWQQREIWIFKTPKHQTVQSISQIQYGCNYEVEN
jgi:hypothetical protein